MSTRFGTLSLFGTSLPTFFLVLSLVATLSILWVHQRAQKLGFDPRRAIDLALLGWVGGIVGSRLFHVLYEAPGYYWEDWSRFWDFDSGGFVFFGGVIVGAAAWFAGVFYFKEGSWKEWADLFAPVLAFGHGVGRVGCLAAGCCYGKFCDLPWALSGRHPVPLYLMIWDLGLVALLLAREQLPESSKWRSAGTAIAAWAVVHGLGRFFFEFLRDDFRGPAFVLSISQWISLILIAGGCLVLRQSFLQAPGDTGKSTK